MRIQGRNISIVGLEEAKGTLLAYDNIAVIEDLNRPQTSIKNEKQNAKTGTASFDLPTGTYNLSEPACNRQSSSSADDSSWSSC